MTGWFRCLTKKLTPCIQSKLTYRCPTTNANLNRLVYPGSSTIHHQTNTLATMASQGNPFEEGSEIRQFLDKIYKLMIDESLAKGCDDQNKVVQFEFPEKLKELLDTEIQYEPENHEKLLELAQKVIKYSVKTGNPRFYNQQFGGINPYSLAGSWLTDSLNTNIHTFEVAPAFVVLEKALFQKICGYVGFPNGEGVFCPGGSFSNFLTVHLARYRRFPDIKKTGMFGSPKLVLYASEEAHYSIQKAGSFLGFGSDNIVAIESDERGKMKTDVLEMRIKGAIDKGDVPLMVMASCGTTVLGAYDNLTHIADICQKYNVWMHTDGAWGGTALLSRKRRHLLEGIERSDSVAWNFHKMGGAILQCAALLIKQKGLLQETNALSATYLFQRDKFYDISYDIGDNTLQCGRKVDALKLWFMWKALGDKGMEARVDQFFDNSEYFTDKIRNTEGFRLLLPKFECTNVCFWYIPPSLRGQTESAEWWDKLSKVAPIIKERMVKKGTLMIGYNPLRHKGYVNFFRLVVVNELQTKQHLDFVVEEIQRLGQDL